MENYHELLAEGHSLRDDGDYTAAVSTFDRARRSAVAVGDDRAAFEAAVMAADSLRLGGRHLDVLGRLLELLGSVPKSADPFDIWLAYELQFEVQLARRPDIRRLDSIAENLNRIEASLPAPKSELHFRQGAIARACGLFADALPHYERAWHYYDGKGHQRFAFSAFAAEMAIKLSDLKLAKAWRRRVENTTLGKHVDTFIALHEYDFLLLGELNAYGCGCGHMQARVHLLQRHSSQDDIHDPSDQSHRSRRLLAPEKTEDVHERYIKLLAIVDYRLACLRFTAGLPAVDDLYYQQPDAIPAKLESLEKPKLDRQLRSFRLTWHLLRRHARRIDALLECDWRTKEADSRWDRARAIATACNAELIPHS